MKKELWRIIPLVLFLLVMLAVANGLFIPKEERGRQSAMINRLLPEFSLPVLLRPGTLFLTNQWKEQVAVVNIFASWCTPCKAEHPALMQMAQAGIPIYGIAWKDTDQNIAAYLQQNGNPFRNIGVDNMGTTTLLFGIAGLPETYVIDKKNRIRFKHAGPLTADVVTQQIQPLLQILYAE